MSATHQVDVMEILAYLVDTSLEVVIRVTYPDREKARLGIGKKVQVLVRHLKDSSKTYAVLGNDVQEALRNIYEERIII